MTFELALRSTLILTVAWLAAFALRRATAATRHLVWHGAVLAVLLAPILAPAVPKFAIPAAPLLAPLATDSSRAQEVATGTDARRTPRKDVANAAVSYGRSDGNTSGHVGVLAAISAFGSIGVLLWFAFGWLVAAGSARRAHQAPGAWQMEFNTLRLRLGIRREVRLGIMGGNGSAVAIGLWRSTVLLPETARAWDDDHRRTVFLHELAHVRRGDCRVQALAQAACAVYWFNPLVWVAAAHLRSEREHACDDEVLRMGAQPSAYATLLLETAKASRRTLTPSAALPMARASELEGRLLSILAAGRARVPAPGSRWAIAAALAMTTCAALGATPLSPPRDGAREAISPAATITYSPFGPDAPSASPTVRLLEDALEHGSQDEREKAAMALAFRSGADVVRALLTALADRDAQVREKAAIGLALRRDDRIIEPLLHAMNDPDAQVREKVAIALGASGDDRAATALQSALNDPDEQVREKARAGLVLLGLTRK